MKKRILIWAIIFLTFAVLLIGEDGKTRDQMILEREKKLPLVSGKERVNVLNQLAYLYAGISNDKSIEFGKQAEALAQKINYYDGEAHALMHLGAGYTSMGDPKKALKCLQKGLEVSYRAEDRTVIPKILNNLGNHYTAVSDYEKGLEAFRESLKIAKEAGQKYEVAMALINIGTIYRYLFDNTAALDYYLQGYQIAEEIGDKRLTGVSCTNIATIYLYWGKHQEALEHYQRGLKIMEELGDNANISTILNGMGVSCVNLKKFDKASEYYNKSLKIARDMGYKRDIVYALGNLASLYERKGDYKKSLEYYQETLKVVRESGERWAISKVLLNVGEIQVKKRDYGEALKSVEEGLAIAKEINALNEISKGYLVLTDLYAGKENYKKALDFHKQYNEINRKILSEKSTKQSNELQAKYEAEKKAKEIEVLKKNDEIRDLELNKAEFIRNALIIGLILVVIILALLFQKYLYLFAFWKKKKHIGQFRLMDKIASGGMGTIFKAHTIAGKSEIAAVKILKEELFADEISKKRFKRESAIIDKLEHPHVVRIMERGESKQQLFIAMEFLEGQTLEDRIREHGQLPLGAALHIMLQISDTVAFIHDKKVIHRDLKPANIMLIEKDGDPNFVKLLDFGLARIEFETHLTQSGNFLGTIEYVPPEQVLETDVSPAGDIFAMGVTFYRMLCGQSPFPGATIIDIMRKIIGEDPEDPSHHRTDIPLELNRLIMNMMHKKPDKRPPAESVKNTLNSIDSGTGIS